MNKKIKASILSMIMISAITFASMATASAFAPPKTNEPETPFVEEPSVVKRIAGKDRYDTSAVLSKRIYKKSQYAVISSGEAFFETLMASTLSSAANVPLLLTKKSSIPEPIMNEIKRLGLKKVVLVKGNDLISQDVQNKIEGMGIETIVVNGNTKNVAIAINELKLKMYFDDLTNIPVLSYVVNAEKYPDAIAVSPLVGVFNTQSILLPYGVPDIDFNGKKVTAVIGGTNSVPNTVSSNIRLAGKDRYSTAVAIAEDIYKKADNVNKYALIIVSGENFADALTAGELAREISTPILLTSSNKLNPDVIKFIKDKRIKEFYVLGGKNSVSDAVLKQLKNLKVLQ